MYFKALCGFHGETSHHQAGSEKAEKDHAWGSAVLLHTEMLMHPQINVSDLHGVYRYLFRTDR